MSIHKTYQMVVIIVLYALFPPITQGEELKVASFNVRAFGQAKMNDRETVSHLVEIVKRYDLILIQEIKDRNGTAIYNFLKRLNSKTRQQFSMLLSPRLGRTSQKENYAYLYRKNRITALESFTWPDKNDIFEREPFIARFRWLEYEFAAIGLHVKPTDASNEIKALREVQQSVYKAWDNDGMVILGDLNADCKYYNPEREGFEFFVAPMVTIIEDSIDTTTSHTDCTYDRILIGGPLYGLVSTAGTYRYDRALGLSYSQALRVSDHYPVEFTFNSDLDLKEPRYSDLPPPLPEDNTTRSYPREPAPPVCGIKPYITLGGYCYATRYGSRTRVKQNCCNF